MGVSGRSFLPYHKRARCRRSPPPVRNVTPCSLQLVATLDRVRGRTYGYFLRVPGTRAIVAHKERRIALMVALSALPAFLLAAFFPTLSLIAAPLLLGVPHLAADYRYLLLRPRWPGLVLLITLLGSLVVLGLRAVELSTQSSLGRWEVAAALLWCGAMIAAARRAPRRKLAVAAAVLAVVSALALQQPDVARLVFGYAHNLVAIGLWLFLFKGARRAALWPLSIIALGALLLLLGGDRWLNLGQGSLGLHVLASSDYFALPSVSSGPAVGIISSFAFLQSVHYAIWLHVIPAQEVSGNRTTTFAQTLRGLRHDFRLGGVLVIGLLTLTTAAGLWLAPQEARTSYTSLSTFHGYMELAIAVYAWLVGFRPRPG